MDETPRLKLPYILASQAQKHVTHNEALRMADVLVQLTVLNRTLTAPPVTPNEGDCHIVAAGATGAWSGKSEQIAAYQDAAWAYFVPQAGWLAYVTDEGVYVSFDGAVWQNESEGGVALEKLGIHTTADTTNRLAVASAATLFNHDGAGHQLKINKSTTGDTASLLLQTNYSGRAEIGLTGNDNLTVKVSADGSSWSSAITVDKASGKIGIGNTAPAYRLDVTPSGVDDGIRINGTTTGANLYLANSDTGGHQYRVMSTGTGNGAGVGKFSVYDATAASTRMLIDSVGNVGIGTTAPKGKLDVFGTTISNTANFYLGGSDQTAGNEVRFYLSPVAAASQQKIAIISEAANGWGRGKLHFALNGAADSSDATKSNALMTLLDSGNVGIGSSNAQAKLHVLGSGAATVANSQIARIDGGITNGLDFGVLTGSPFTWWMQARNNSTPSLTYPLSLNPSGGNVGIGTTSPSSALHIINNGGGSGNVGLTIENSTPTTGKTWRFTSVDADGTFRFTHPGFVDAAIMNPTTGYFGLACTPTDRLTVAGNAIPSTDNTYTCGKSGSRWSAIWAANGTIQTSDARDKNVVSAIDGEVATAMVEAVDPVLFRWIDGGGVEVTETIDEEVEIQATEDLETEESAIEVIDGKAVMTVKTVTKTVPLFDSIPVVDADGAPVLDENGEQQMHSVPRMTKVTRARNVTSISREPGHRIHAGFIAQDIKAAMQAQGLDFGAWGLEDKGDPDSKQWLRPDQLVPVLWAALKESRANVVALERRISRLEGTVRSL